MINTYVKVNKQRPVKIIKMRELGKKFVTFIKSQIKYMFLAGV